MMDAGRSKDPRMMEQLSVEMGPIDMFGGLVISIDMFGPRHIARHPSSWPYGAIWLRPVMMDAAPLLPDLRICRGCGCTDLHACPGGCSWALLDLYQAVRHLQPVRGRDGLGFGRHEDHRLRAGTGSRRG